MQIPQTNIIIIIKMFNHHILALKMNFNVFTISRNNNNNNETMEPLQSFKELYIILKKIS